jgi:hypothetical protein
MRGKGKIPFEVTVVSIAVALALVVWRLPGGSLASFYRMPAWVFDEARLRLSLKQDASAGGYHERAMKGPLALATIVAELHTAWPGESATVVNHVALEVAVDLLHHSDVEAGEIVGGTFRPLALPPWAVNQKIRADLLTSRDFFQDTDRYVFRKR